MNKSITFDGAAGDTGARRWKASLARCAALLVSFAAALLPAHAAAAAPAAAAGAVAVTLPNGYANINADDLYVATTAGAVRWSRVWDGQEWKFNPQWESLSQSWKNMTGSQTADTTAGTVASPSQLLSAGGSASDGGCWVWVDEDWQPSYGTTTTGGIPAAAPMVPVRTTPFNRMMGEASADYLPVQHVTVDYASLCAGTVTASAVVDLEGIRRANELYLGEGGRYAFSNRSVLEKRAVRTLPLTDAASAYAALAGGRITLAPVTNAKGFRWIDKSGDWIDYDTQGRVVAWGDKNDNIVWMLRDRDGVLRGVVDAAGRVVYSLHYTGELVTEIRDYAAGADDQARSVKYRYDESNRLTQVTDARGYVTRYDYDAASRIVKVTDAEGRAEQLAYAGSGTTVKQRIAPDGGITDYSFDYDDTNKQFASKITGPETAAGRRVESYTHNRSGKLVRVLVNGRVDKEVRYDTGSRTRIETNARGFTSRITNNEFDQVLEVALPDGASKKRSYSTQHLGLTEVVDELGYKTQYQYDAKGNLVKLLEAAATVDQRVTEYVRNGLGQLVQSTRKGGTEINGTVTADATWTIEYDVLGQVSKTTDPEGKVRQYAYDHAGNLVRFTDPLGFSTRYEVDAGGNLLKASDALGRVWAYQYDRVGNLTTETNARNKAVQNAYDAMNRQAQRLNEVGGTYKMQYNGQGLPVSETDEDGRTSVAEFDAFLRLTREIDGMGNVTEYNYNIADGSAAGTLGSLGAPTEIKFPTYTQRQRYDQAERPTSDTVLNPNSLGTEGLVSSSEYDKRGQMRSATDANGKTRYYTYDALGQMTEATDSLGNKTKAMYDLRGNLIQITDAKGNVNRFEFDRNNRVVKEILPLGQVTTYQYDDAGNVLQRSAPDGGRSVFSYDLAGRVKEAKLYKAGGVLARTMTYAWDAEDNLTGWSDTDHPLARTTSAVIAFDDANRKTGETVTYPGGSTLGYGYTYSAAGNKTALTWPDGTRIGYTYSAHNELDSVTIPGEGAISVAEFKWVAPAKIALPGGTTKERTLDGLLNLEGLRVKGPNQQTVLTLANTYGKVQELKTSTRTDTVGGASATRSNAYQYDAENRLTQAVADNGGVFGTDTENFTLDAVGNRIAHSKVSGAWTYDANNRLIQRGTGSAATTYDYDASGNQTKRTEPGGKVTLYEYDPQNRLVQVKDGSGNLVARYGYDPMDRRTWREQFRDRDGSALAQALRTFYLYADEGLVAESTQNIVLNGDGTVSAAGEPVIATQYGPRPDADFTTGILFVKTRSSNGQQVFAYFHHDQIDAPVQATDKLGRLVWSANYNAFGQASITTPLATAEAPTINSTLRLPGQIEDAETGLHYNFRRYYDPSTGRYISQDPIGFEGGDNKYRYAAASPTNLTDPTGECPMCVAYAVCVAECMLEDVAVNTITGDCNNFGDSAKSCAASCLLGGLGRVGKWLNRGCNSFPSNTLVNVKPKSLKGNDDDLAMQGKAELKEISQLQVGDEVLALAEWKDKGRIKGQDQRLSYEKITDVFTSNEEQVLIHITLNDGEKFTSTSGHSFNTEKGWRDAISLKQGDNLITPASDLRHPGKLKNITKVEYEKKVLQVFNLEVSNAHTFLIGIDAVIAHNGSCKLPRYPGKKPNYHVNDAHLPGRNPNKTPLPKDAEDVYKKAVPDSPTNPRNWYGKNAEGDTYRYGDSNNGTAHFSGRDNVAPGIRNMTDYAKDRLGGK